MNDLLDVKMVLKEAVFTSKRGCFCLAGKDETGWKNFRACFFILCSLLFCFFLGADMILNNFFINRFWDIATDNFCPIIRSN